MAAPPPSIELRDVAIESRQDALAPSLRGVDWQVRPGEFWVVGGMAGTGKTRLLETAAGLRPPAAGEVWLFGERADRLSAEAARGLRRRLGFVYGAGGRLVSHLTVAENLALPLCYHRNCVGEAVAGEVDRWLVRFELEALARRLPGQVNAAARQRAAVARALTLRPEILFLDDPLAELNTAQIRWWQSWWQAAEGGGEEGLRPATMVVATDDLRPWLGVARQFALLRDGRWQVVGGREELAAAPAALLRELLAESLGGR